MSTLYSILIVVHVLVAFSIVGLILMQHGKGADMGAAFGSGASGSLFGATGSANFLSRTTAVLATVFFLTSLGLAYIVAQPSTSSSIMQTPVQSQPDTVPSVAVPPPGQTGSESQDTKPQAAQSQTTPVVEEAGSSAVTPNQEDAQNSQPETAASSEGKVSPPAATEDAKVNEIPSN